MNQSSFDALLQIIPDLMEVQLDPDDRFPDRIRCVMRRYNKKDLEFYAEQSMDSERQIVMYFPDVDTTVMEITGFPNIMEMFIHARNLQDLADRLLPGNTLNQALADTEMGVDTMGLFMAGSVSPPTEEPVKPVSQKRERKRWKVWV